MIFFLFLKVASLTAVNEFLELDIVTRLAPRLSIRSLLRMRQPRNHLSELLFKLSPDLHILLTKSLSLKVKVLLSRYHIAGWQRATRRRAHAPASHSASHDHEKWPHAFLFGGYARGPEAAPLLWYMMQVLYWDQFKEKLIRDLPYSLDLEQRTLGKWMYSSILLFKLPNLIIAVSDRAK